MSLSGTRDDACETIDADLAESIVLEANVQLPLLPRQADGSWVAPLKRFPHCDLRLVELVPPPSDKPALHIAVRPAHSFVSDGAGLRRGGRRRRRVLSDGAARKVILGGARPWPRAFTPTWAVLERERPWCTQGDKLPVQVDGGRHLIGPAAPLAPATRKHEPALRTP